MAMWTKRPDFGVRLKPAVTGRAGKIKAAVTLGLSTLLDGRRKARSAHRGRQLLKFLGTMRVRKSITKQKKVA